MEDTRRYSFQPPESAIGPPTRYIFSPSFTVNAVRSIPARAGEPSQASARACASGVYPRACGGTHLPEYPAQPCKGLSPRVRGNLPRPNPHCKGHWSIPARAGEPCSTTSTAKGAPVYPRACGGTGMLTGYLWESLGLSPRVRGYVVPKEFRRRPRARLSSIRTQFPGCSVAEGRSGWWRRRALRPLA